MQHERGFTLVELAITSAIMVVVSAITVQSLHSLSVAQKATHAAARVASLTERTVGRIEIDAGYAMRVFQENEHGRSHLARLDLAAILAPGEAPLAGARLPVATNTGAFTVDPEDAPETGNMLALGRRDGTIRVESTTDETPHPRRIDVLRIVCWFLHDGPDTGVDLARWSSPRLARLADITATGDPARRARLVANLCAAGVRHAWDPAADADTAFSALGEDGAIVPMGAGDLLPPDPEQCEVGIGATRHIGVAKNGTPGTDVPMFAHATAGFPHGLEFKRDGDGSGDLLLIRLVLATTTDSGRQVAVNTTTRQVAFREQ